MREIDFSGAFKKDFKAVKRIPQYRDIENDLGPILELLRQDLPLPDAHRDHALV